MSWDIHSRTLHNGHMETAQRHDTTDDHHVAQRTKALPQKDWCGWNVQTMLRERNQAPHTPIDTNEWKNVYCIIPLLSSKPGKCADAIWSYDTGYIWWGWLAVSDPGNMETSRGELCCSSSKFWNTTRKSSCIHNTCMHVYTNTFKLKF